MRTLNFLKLSPGGNSTILITTPDIASGARMDIAAKLMHPLHLQAEQVGFIRLDNSPPRLDMMGQEFCLNATRCLAFAMAYDNRFIPLAQEDDFFGLVSCSGYPHPLQVRIKNGKKILAQDCTATALTPLECFLNIQYKPKDFSIHKTENSATLVRLPGISHLLLPESVFPVPPDPISTAAKWRHELKLEQEAACGVVWYRQDQGSTCHITPVVYVAATGSSVLESACGSASLALALALTMDLTQGDKRSNLALEIIQPSREFLHVSLQITPNPDNYQEPADVSFACAVELGGQVRLCARGEAFI